MRRNRIKGAMLCAAGMFLLTGCGTPAYTLTEAEEGVIVNYAAHVVSKYNSYQKDGLVSVETEIVQDTETADTQAAEDVTEDTQTTETAAQAGQTAGESSTQTTVTSLEELFAQTGLTVSYAGCELTDSYGEGDVFNVQQFAGKQYLVCSFDIANQTADPLTLDNLSEGLTFRIAYSDVEGNSGQASQYSTIMTNDFSTYEETVAAGETKQAVLLFQIPDTVTEVTDLVLYVSMGGTVYEITL